MDQADAPNAATVAEGARQAASRERLVVVAGYERDLRIIEAHLADADPGVRAAALGALRRTGSLGPGSLCSAMEDPHPDVRARAAELAAGFTSTDLRATDLPATGLPAAELTATELQATDLRATDLPATELQATELQATELPAGDRSPARSNDFGEATLVDLRAALLRLLDDPDDRVVEVAAFACGELPRGYDDTAWRQRVGALAATATEHHDSRCREAAVAALGALGDPSGLPAVLAGCRDRPNVRRRAVLALASFEGTEVTGMLEELTADRDLQVRQAAEDLLAIETGEDT